jgi:putative ABC transport system permease protein
MVITYFKLFTRNLHKNRFHHFLNIIGLSVGFASSLFLYLYCQDELSFDEFHPNHNLLYKVVDTYTFSEQPVNSATVSAPMGPALTENIPEIELAVRINKVSGIVKSVQKEADDFQFEKILIVDSGFFEIFGFTLLEGDPNSVLVQPNSVVVTQRVATQLFGNVNAVGQTIQTNLLGGKTMMVSGVAANPPSNSHIQFDLLVSHSSMINVVPTLNNWLVYGTHTYIRVKPGTNAENLRPKFKKLIFQNVATDMASKYNHHAVPVTELHLGISRRSDLEPTGTKLVVDSLQIVTGLILLLSVANYISLSLSLATNRMKEAGVRKVLGSSRLQIGIQFISETVTISIGCAFLGLFMLYGLLGFLNDLSGKSFQLSHLLESKIVIGILLTSIAAGVISGLFAALFLSRLLPIDTLKNASNAGKLNKQKLRNLLVIFQFTVAIALFISLDILTRQVNYLQTRNLGFNKEGALIIPINSPQIGKSRVALLEEFKKIPNVLSVTTASGVPSKNFGFGPFRLEGGDTENNAIFNIASVDADYLNTMALKMAAGRAFDKTIASDSSAFILNEAAVHILGINSIEEAVGKILEMHGANSSGPLKKGSILGVSQNFHYKSLREEVEPLVLHIGKGGYAYFIIHVSSSSLTETLQDIQTKWSNFEPNQSMIYSFMDDDLSNLYRAEEKLDRVFTFFTILTLLISCIGLFSLSSYAVLLKVKEISIRKVYGAETRHIAIWLGTIFIKLVIVSFMLACPIAYYAGSAWLKTFAYHDSITVTSFILAGVLAITITIATTGYHTLKASLANPVKNLRAE